MRLGDLLHGSLSGHLDVSRNYFLIPFANGAEGFRPRGAGATGGEIILWSVSLPTPLKRLSSARFITANSGSRTAVCGGIAVVASNE